MGTVRVAQLSSEIEAISLKSFLLAEGIKSIIKSYQVTPYGSSQLDDVPTIGTIMHGGWGELQVDEKDAERARKIIEDIRKSIDKNE